LVRNNLTEKIDPDPGYDEGQTGDQFDDLRGALDVKSFTADQSNATKDGLWKYNRLEIAARE
jgi:hypothetical protein